jgi:hypothetical protein
MQAALERLIEQIKSAPIDPLPSDNIWMVDVFDPSLYAEILSRLPADEDYDFIEHPDAVLPDGTQTRKFLDLTDSTISRLKPECRIFWRKMKDTLTSESLQEAVVQRFQQKIKERFSEQYPEMVTVPVLYRDFPGYRASVHPDAPFMIAALQFYFLEDDVSRIHLETSFHQKEGQNPCLLKIKLVAPNSAYAFLPTDENWLSCEQMDPLTQKRDMLTLAICEKRYHHKSS